LEITKFNCSVNNDILTESLYCRVTLHYIKVSCRVCLHLRNVNKQRIRIRQLGNFNIRRMSNAVKLFEIRQHSNSNSNFVTS